MLVRRPFWNRLPSENYPKEAHSCWTREVAQKEENIRTEVLVFLGLTQKLPVYPWLTPWCFCSYLPRVHTTHLGLWSQLTDQQSSWQEVKTTGTQWIHIRLVWGPLLRPEHSVTGGGFWLLLWELDLRPSICILSFALLIQVWWLQDDEHWCLLNLLLSSPLQNLLVFISWLSKTSLLVQLAPAICESGSIPWFCFLFWVSSLKSYKMPFRRSNPRAQGLKHIELDSNKPLQ